MAALASWPEATWFTKGTPTQVKGQVAQLVRRAALQRAVPVLVAYDIPLRDCSQYSAGGAQSDADYRAWIAALAKGLGSSKAVVILEPDALANLPSDCGSTADPTGAITAARIADINYAIGALESQPGTSVYLDAGHSQWHSVGDMASRLIQAGVAKAQGFFLNVSNFQPTEQVDQYGTWVSKCIWFATKGPDWAAGHTDYCASQYYSGAAPNDGLPGNAVSPTDPSTWHWTDAWFDQNVGTPPAAEPDPLRRRHQPERAGRLDAPRRQVHRRSADLVQPARPRYRGPAHRPYRSRPGRCLPVDQDHRRIRRPMQPRNRRGHNRSRVRPGGSRRRRLVAGPGDNAGQQRQTPTDLQYRRLTLAEAPTGLQPAHRRCAGSRRSRNQRARDRGFHPGHPLSRPTFRAGATPPCRRRTRGRASGF